MNRSGQRSTIREISEINMTPLMDLTFILLITFIITFPLIEQGVPVNLPKGEAQELDEHEARTLTLDLQGQLFLDDQPVSRQQLAGEMKALGRADPQITIFVRADEMLPYGKIVELMRLLQDANITRMALITQPEPKRRP